MKVAVMGAGALGGYFGGRVAASGADVSFVARGAYLVALQKQGLKVESPLGDFHLPKIKVTDSPADIGPVDLILFLVKLFDTEQAAKQITPMVGPDTTIVSFQNGIDPWDKLKAIFGDDKVLGGLATIMADVKSPGIVRHKSPFANLFLGAFDGTLSDKVKEIEKVLDVPGQTATAVTDINIKIWEKFIFLTAFSGITALTRLSIGKVLEDPETRDLFISALEEVATVGKLKCPGLPDDVIDQQLAFAGNLPFEVHSSMLGDLTRGKRLELDHLSGKVARLGKEVGVPTPVQAFMHAALNPFKDGAR